MGRWPLGIDENEVFSVVLLLVPFLHDCEWKMKRELFLQSDSGVVKGQQLSNSPQLVSVRPAAMNPWRPSRWLSYQSDRKGFTLIELLVVITIIAIMMGLSFSVLYGLTDQAKEEAANATIRKVNALLEQRIESFDRAFKGTRKQSYINATNGLLADPNNDGNTNDRIVGVREEVVEVLAKKAAFRFEFPQRMVELLLSPSTDDTNSNGLPDTIEVRVAIPAARQFLVAADAASATPTANYSPSPTEISDLATARWAGGSSTAVVGGASKTFTFTGHNGVTESSELLHYMLINSGSFGSSSVDSDRFTNDEVVDTDNDGLPEFIDAWQQPLRFYRWPTRMMDPFAPSPFLPDLNDSNDPTDVIIVDGGAPVGQRAVSQAERDVASLLFKSLPPIPQQLPGSALPRDLLLTDPDDPVGRLYSELERLNGSNGASPFSAEYNETKYHTPDTYHAPLILSAGPDGRLGLREPLDVNPGSGIFGNLAQYEGTTVSAPAPTVSVIDSLTDNISNLNRRSGGRK